MKVIISGGHLSPAFSVIEKLDKKQVLFVGRKYALQSDKSPSLEYKFCQKLGVKFVPIKTTKFQRNSIKNSIISCSKLPLAIAQAAIIIKKFKPDVILGFGGYISLPVIFAAKILHIPIVVHEQTLEAGIANKIAGKLADKICISWESSSKFFPKKKTVITGNPIRSDFFELSNKKSLLHFENNLPTIYITGGSIGAHAINVLTESVLKDLLKVANVVHQTGDASEYSDFERLSKKKKENYVIRKFFHTEELVDIFKAADLVISRSGINTITELIWFKKPALLIPLPVGQKDEQLKNANFYKNLGMASVHLQKELTKKSFLENIKLMLSNLQKYNNKSLDTLVNKDVADKIINVLKDVT